MLKNDIDLIAEDDEYWAGQLGEQILRGSPKPRCAVCDERICGDYGIKIEGVAVCEDCIEIYAQKHYAYKPTKGEKCERCGAPLGGIMFYTKAYKIGGERLCDECFWDEVKTFEILND